MPAKWSKKEYWASKREIHCPLCQKPYKNLARFFQHLQYFHKLGYEGAGKVWKEYFTKLRSLNKPKPTEDKNP